MGLIAVQYCTISKEKRVILVIAPSLLDLIESPTERPAPATRELSMSPGRSSDS